MLRLIERVSIDELTWESFDERYYATETPVLVTGCEVGDCLSVEQVRSSYMKSDARETGWYDACVTDRGGEGTIPVPKVVARVLEQSDVATRALPMRVWMHPGGHKSFLHYDGNSLCGLNLQVIGRKSWTLISADTSVPFSPFNFIAAVDRAFEPDPDRYDVYRFETEPGDMLFVPRYWPHGVESLASVNVNANWVWTPRYPNSSTRLGRREVELLRLRQMLPFLDVVMASAAATYGGAGASIINRYTAPVARRDAIRRLVLELSQVPRFLFRAPSLRRELREFTRNNFNVRGHR